MIKPKPSNDEITAARFYDAMLLLVAQGSFATEALKMALEWAKEEADKDRIGGSDGLEKTAWLGIIAALEPLTKDL
jgi:hypothetical protein